jgi:organic radical activating enzyme
MDEMIPSEVINSKNMISVRESLSNGEFPPGCFDCAYKETLGLKSYRMQSLENKAWDPDNTIDYSITTIPNILDIELKFSRSCNFLCRHCDSESNSMFDVLGDKNPEIRNDLINANSKHLVRATSPIKSISTEIIDDLIANVIPKIEKISFSGGEPLYHKAHYEFLQKLIDEPSINTKKINLGYNTNLSLLNFKNYDLMTLWKEFKSISITVSFDGTGKLFNYFRVRGDYETIVNNLYTIIKHSNNIKSVLLVCTSTAYHAFYADTIFKDLINIKTQIESINQAVYVNVKPTFVHTPTMDMVNLDTPTKDFIIEKLTNSLTNNELYNRCITEITKYLKSPIKDPNIDFKIVAKLQDKLHKTTPEFILPRLWNYIYKNNLYWD